MTTSAIAGVGAEFQRENDSSSLMFTAISEVNSISGPNKSRDTIEVTSLDSASGYKEYIPSFRDAGEVTLGLNFTRDGYVQLNNDFESDTIHSYRIVFPDTGETTLDFDGYVTAVGSAISVGDKVTFDATVKISGAVSLSS